MHEIRRTAWPLAVLVLTSAALATPPKPGIEGVRPGPGEATAGKQDKGGGDRIAEMNSMALRGGVPQDVWLEGLHRLTRVSSPRREEITRAVRRYQVEIASWQATKVPVLKELGAQARAARQAGEPVPSEVSEQLREIRRTRPMLPDLQRRVWTLLTGPERARLADELSELKRSGLPKDVKDGRRPAGSPARVTPKREDTEAGGDEAGPTEGRKDALPPLLWSFADDPNAGKPLPEPEEVKSTKEPETAE